MEITVIDLLQMLREMAINQGMKYTIPMGQILGVLFVMFRMIKIAHTLMSDEEKSGFGGLRLIDLAKPVLMLMLIQGSGLVMGGFDNLCSWVSNGIYNEFKKSEVSQASMLYIHKNVQDSIENSKKATTQGTGTGGNQGTSAPTPEGGTVSPAGNTSAAGSTEEEDSMVMKFLKDALKTVKQFFAGMIGLTGDVVSMGISAFALAAMKTLYNCLFNIFIGFAEVSLALMAMFFPLWTAVSILPQTESQFPNFFTGYAQLAMWKAIAAIMDWLISCGIALAFEFQVSSSLDNMASGNIWENISNNSTVNATLIILLLVGIVSFFKIGAIAQMLIPSAMSVTTGESGSAGAVGNLTGSVFGKAGGAVKTLIFKH